MVCKTYKIDKTDGIQTQTNVGLLSHGLLIPKDRVPGMTCQRTRRSTNKCDLTPVPVFVKHRQNWKAEIRVAIATWRFTYFNSVGYNI